jgi:hypothetical protein
MRRPPPASGGLGRDRGEVQRLATEGTEDEVWRYRYDHTLTEAQTGALLERLDQLHQAHRQAADEAYRVARELAPYELLPSPTWEVMCSELEWPV